MSDLYSGKRIFYLDELRVVAILCVILCHTARFYGDFKYTSLKVAIPGFLDIIGLVGVPLFFMISGALLLNRTYTLGDFFKRRFTRILYPAVFWIAIAVILYAFIKPSNILPVIFGINNFTWFIWVMVGIYLIIPVINSFIKEYGIKGTEYFLAIWFITIILNTLGMYPFKNLELTFFAGFLGYSVAGYYLANKDFKINKLALTIIGIAMFVVFTVLNMYRVYNGTTFTQQYLTVYVSLASIGVFIAFRSFSEYCDQFKSTSLSRIHEKLKNNKFGVAIFTVSICSYGMYFANSIIRIIINPMHIHSLKLFPVLYLIMAVGSFAIVFAMSKVPVLKKFSGV